MRPDNIAESILYKLLSTAGGKDLRESKREEIREKRKEFIDNQEVLGGPPFRSERVMEVLVELGMREAELVENFDPDLLIVGEIQFKALFDLPAAVALNPDDWPKMVRDNTFETERRQIEPPRSKKFGDYKIDVTYSGATDRMLLVDSSELSTREML